ncbi:MAG: HPP family protein [Gammaproteobacteria bacterium]|nr:HPP family protein [Gammaproteobacteria bacterium]
MTQVELSHRRILLSAASALIAVGLVALISQLSLSGRDVPLLAASIGASAVLLFATPTSNFSSPWAFVGGHMVSVLIGITCARWIPSLPLAAASAVSLAIVAMFYLRCLHPPGGASALMVVLGGESVQQLGYQFALTPVLLNVAVMLACAMLYWHLAGIRRHSPIEEGPRLHDDWQRREEEWLAGETPFSHQDLLHAMGEMDTYLDISEHDLQEIYARAMQRAHQYALDGIRCGDIMSQPVISVEYGTELGEAWALFERHYIRGLPVVDSFRRVQGIITVSDFVHMANEFRANGEATDDSHGGMAEHLAWLRQRTPGFESDKPEVAGQLMTTPVITAWVDDPVSELVPLFTQHAIHHMPVVDERRRLVGMLTREDVMAARAGAG